MIRLVLCAAMSALLGACTPTLNWRDVTLERITVLLPCKPDRAKRIVKLGQDDVVMQMAGCEVGKLLYAMSHVKAKNVVGIPDAIEKWQAVALANLHASPAQHLPWQIPKGADTAVRLFATGQSANVGGVQANLAWFTVGMDIYHVAVYAPQLTIEQSEPILSDLRIR